MTQQIARIAIRTNEVRFEVDVVRKSVLEECALLLKATYPDMSSFSRGGLI